MAETLDKKEYDTLSISERVSSAISGILLALAREVFSEETVVSLLEYGNVLKDIHSRLVSEGYVWRNGKFYKK